jgi:hypothetical protein
MIRALVGKMVRIMVLNISYINVRHMADEALDFAKNTLFAGAQPSIVRKILQDKFFTNLISRT